MNTYKKSWLALLSSSMLSLVLLAGCSGSGDGSDEPLNRDEAQTRALVQKTSMEGAINDVADVDWYTIEISEAGIVAINIYNDTLRYDVDVLATVYEQDSSGNLQRLAADHFPEGSAASSSLSINLNVSQPKMLYVAVRDLNDDDFSATETYSISYDVAAPEDNNGSFDSAERLTIGGTCYTDSIGTVGDTDVMNFTVSNAGVYQVATEFSAFGSGTAVSLNVSLFDSEGQLVRRVTQTEDSTYRLVESLAVGDYYLIVHDDGQDNFDTASPFTTCVENVSTSEVAADDSQIDATELTGDGSFSFDGSLDYAGDKDWSRFDSGAAPQSIQVLQIEFDPTESNGCNAWFLLELTDANDKVLFSKEYSTETGPKTAYIKVESSGEHFVSLSSVDENVCTVDGELGMAYSASIDVVDVDDDAEMGDGNNAINEATEIDETSDTPVQAKLSYVGDVDWYRVTVPADHDNDRILEISLETDSPTELEYYVSIFRTDEILDNFTGEASADYTTTFKSSYLILSSPGNTNSDYFIKVVDLQSDEADINGNYTIQANILPVETQAPADDSNAPNAQFFSETDEQDQLAIDNNVVELIVGANDKREYSFNATAHTVTAEVLSGIVIDGDSMEVTFPWQTGYIDFYNDRDWYQLDIDAIYSAAGGTAEDWYVEIGVELYSPGSTVEYAWGLFRDSSNNGAVNDWQGNDGLYASNGDVDAAVSEINLVTPTSEAEPMWISNQRAEDDFYLTIADVINESTNTADNDWGYDAPYYVRVSLKFHSNAVQPEG